MRCRSRCPECRCQCTASHGTEYNEVGTVSLALDHLNPSGYPQTFHGHQFGRWQSRTGWAIHAWRVRPEDKFAVVPVKAEKAKVRPKAAFAKGANKEAAKEQA